MLLAPGVVLRVELWPLLVLWPAVPEGFELCEELDVELDCADSAAAMSTAEQLLAIVIHDFIETSFTAPCAAAQKGCKEDAAALLLRTFGFRRHGSCFVFVHP